MSVSDVQSRSRVPPWLLYALATMVLWGFWGAFTGLSAERGFPDTLVYCVWSLTMIVPALIVLARSGWKLDRGAKALSYGMIIGLLGAGGQMILFYALIGVTLGTAVGVLPGIGPALTVALLLPVTYRLDPTGSLIMFAGIYYGGMYGGSTTSILLNTPGESASIVTALEGNKMARAGRGGPALATAAIGSFVAGLLATVALAFLAPYVVKLALVFGPREYFALMMLAFVTVSAAFGDSTLKGLTSLFIGLALALVGIDQLTGQARLSFGVPELLDGVEVTTLAVALFAIGEALFVVSQGAQAPDTIESVKGSVWMTRADWARSWKPWLRGTAIGFPIGAMPAGGAEIGTLLSYATEKRLAKNPEEFGHGAIEGVAGPEAANNASAAGTLVPLLTLGQLGIAGLLVTLILIAAD